MGFVSVFNDVIGPIMRGPSSSHTAGAYRIACLARGVLGTPPLWVRCSFDAEGSYAPTYRSLGVEQAFAAGLLGWEMTDPRYDSAVRSFAKSGGDLTFAVEPLEHVTHPNTMLVEIAGADHVAMKLWARSTGGGCIEVFRVDDTQVMIGGKERILLVFLHDSGSRMEAECLAQSVGAMPLKADGGRILVFSLMVEASLDHFDGLRRIPGVERFCAVDAAFYPRRGEALFASGEELLRLADQRGWSLGEAAREYEATLLGVDGSWVEAEVLRRYRIMEDSIAAGMESPAVNMPLTQPSASAVMSAARNGILPYGGSLTRAAARAMAVMHTSNGHGVVCAAPTGGSAGVLPGVITTMAEEHGLTDPEIARALLAAAAVGLIVAVRATFAAEVAGCQVEIGVAGAMAAASIIDAAGGSAAAALDAASIALQNSMGSVCDPVHGGCEIPCHTRNAAAAAGAFICADLAIGGYANPIPLDEAIDASYAVGKSLPPELRCTAKGGIAVTPSALRMRPRD